MAKVYDILVDENGEDIVKDGDDFIEESTRQHSQFLIMCEKGENKMEPVSGVGIASWLLDEAGEQELKKSIQEELEGDGQVIEFINVKDVENIQVAGVYGQA
jgi:hypothetical protein